MSNLPTERCKELEQLVETLVNNFRIDLMKQSKLNEVQGMDRVMIAGITVKLPEPHYNDVFLS